MIREIISLLKHSDLWYSKSIMSDNKNPKVEVLPANVDIKLDALYEVAPVSLECDDDETTSADLAMLNNHLMMNDLMLRNTRSIVSMCALAASACKLIELRRKVKKLQLGAATEKDSGRGKTYTILK